MISHSLTVPVLLIGFNRPETIMKVFENIRNAKPDKLYVAIDGPRYDRIGEDILVNKVKEIVINVDWPCKVHYRFNEQNKGAEITVSSAITWALENEDYTIVLEDDVVAPLSFFNFMEEMLIKYKNESNIAMVSGCNYTPIITPRNIDYFFARSGHTWGWGTWKKIWEGFDLNMPIKNEYLELSFLKENCSNLIEAKYTQLRFSQMKKKGTGHNNWDYMFSYYRTINGLLSIVPKVNLTSNIGAFGLHYDGMCDELFMPFDENFIVINHPESFFWFKKYDKYHFKKHVLIPLLKRKIGKYISQLRDKLIDKNFILVLCNI